MSKTFSADASPELLKLRRKGWTLRPAARELGVDHAHLYRVLRGQRESISLLARVAALPHLKKSARHR
jgi:transcriptional regulator with XRE-family HTH domain